jgi:hypothetical protein
MAECFFVIRYRPERPVFLKRYAFVTWKILIISSLAITSYETGPRYFESSHDEWK